MIQVPFTLTDDDARKIKRRWERGNRHPWRAVLAFNGFLYVFGAALGFYGAWVGNAFYAFVGGMLFARFGSYFHDAWKERRNG